MLLISGAEWIRFQAYLKANGLQFKTTTVYWDWVMKGRPSPKDNA